ncbi:hypothetical protein ACO0SA_000715 [Hanseniaspora valbyensis]
MAYGRSLRNGTRKRKLNYNGPLNNMKKPKIKHNKETKSLETNTTSNNNNDDDILEIDESLLKIDSESDRDAQNANNSKNTTDDNSLKNVNIVASPSKRTLQGAKKTKTYHPRSPLTKNDSGIESSFDNGANTSKIFPNKKNNTSLSDILNKMNQRKVLNETIDFSFENELKDSDDLAFVVNEDNTFNNKKNKISSLDQFNKYSSVRANRINITNKKNQSEKEIVHLKENDDVNISNMKEKENKSQDIDINDLTSKRNGLSDVKTPIRFNTAKIVWKNQNGNYNYQYFDKNKEKLQLGASFSFTTDKISYENVEIFSYKSGFEAVVLEFKTPIKLRKTNSKSTGSLQSVVILKSIAGLLTERFEKANNKLIVNKNYKITFRTQLKDKYKLGDESGFNSLKDKTYNSLTKQQFVQKRGPSYSNKGNVISSPSSGINKSNKNQIETHNEVSTSLSRNGIDPGSFFGNNDSNKNYTSSLRGLRKLEDVSKIDEENLKTERENAKPNTNIVSPNQSFSGRVTRSKTGSSNPKTRKRYTEIFDDTEYEKTQPLEMDLKHFFSDGSSLIIHDKDYQCLFNGQWLNGTVIDFFNKFFKDDVFKLQVTPKLENLKKVEKEKKEEKKEEKKRSLNNLEKVVQSRWLLKDDCAVIKKHKYHIIPVNINYHWFGCILEDFYEKCLETQSMIKDKQQKPLTLRTKDLPKITIYVFDSLRNLHQKELQPIKDFLILFALTNFNIKLNPVQLKLRNSQVIKQPNMNDCGVHLISNIKVFMKFTEKTIRLWNSCSFTGDDPELISFFKETYVKTSRKPLREILASLLEIAKTKKDSNNIALEPIKMDSKSDSEDDELNKHKINEPSVLQKLSDLQLEEEEDEENNKNFIINAEIKKAANEEIDRVFAESDSETSDDKNPITSNSQELKLAHEIDLFSEKTENNKQSGIEELNEKNLTLNTSKYFDKKNSTKPSVNSDLLKDRKDNIAKSSQNIESSDQEFTNDDKILYEKDEEKLKDLDELNAKIQAVVNPEQHNTGKPILILLDSTIQKQSSFDDSDSTNFDNDTNNSQIDSLSDNIRHRRKRKINNYKE